MKNYKNLAYGILQQAVKDYLSALKTNNKSKIEYFEKWFVGDWAQLLSDDMGEVIIERCRKQVMEGVNDG